MELFALDSNVYIQALRDLERLRRLKYFLRRKGTRVRLAAVVAMELRAGARSKEQHDAVEELFAPYIQRDLVFAPTFDAFAHTGRVLAELASTPQFGSGIAAQRLTNDALLAASCREKEITLVTANTRDFHAIKPYLRGFRWVDVAEAFE